MVNESCLKMCLKYAHKIVIFLYVFWKLHFDNLGETTEFFLTDIIKAVVHFLNWSNEMLFETNKRSDLS